MAEGSPASCWRARRSRGPDAADRLRRELEARIGTRVEPLDFRGAVALRDRIAAAPELLDSLAPVDRRHPARAGRVMLRTNLATRPFYNERAIHLLVALAAAIVLAVTVLNVGRIVTLSKHSTELSRAHECRSRRSAAAEHRSDPHSQDDQQGRARAGRRRRREANALIDQRTFSWTEFFNQIEATLPPDVMLTSVRPSFKDGVTTCR